MTAANPTRIDDSGKRRALRLWIAVTTQDIVAVTVGAALTSPSRLQQKARVVRVTPNADEGETTEVVLELPGGMGRSLTPTPGSVPEVGEWICYTTLSDAYTAPGSFPSKDETPWTHGGPPAPYEDGPLTTEDAREERS